MTSDKGGGRHGHHVRWRLHNGDGARGDEVNDDGDGTMSNDGDGATGDEVDDDGDEVDDDGDDDDYGDGQ